MTSRQENISVCISTKKDIRFHDMTMHLGMWGNEFDPEASYIAIYDKKGFRIEIPAKPIIDKYKKEIADGN